MSSNFDDDSQLPVPAHEEEYIVIPKSWLIAGVVGVVAFILGGVTGALVMRAVGPPTVADVPSDVIVQPQAAQPTARPTVPPIIEGGVNVDDDPSIGPPDAPIQIVEFSDFR